MVSEEQHLILYSGLYMQACNSWACVTEHMHLYNMNARTHTKHELVKKILELLKKTKSFIYLKYYKYFWQHSCWLFLKKYDTGYRVKYKILCNWIKCSFRKISNFCRLHSIAYSLKKWRLYSHYVFPMKRHCQSVRGFSNKFLFFFSFM